MGAAATATQAAPAPILHRNSCAECQRRKQKVSPSATPVFQPIFAPSAVAGSFCPGYDLSCRQPCKWEGGYLYQQHPHSYAMGPATQASAIASLRLVSDMRRPSTHCPSAGPDISGAFLLTLLRPPVQSRMALQSLPEAQGRRQVPLRQFRPPHREGGGLDPRKPEAIAAVRRRQCRERRR